MHSDAAVDRPRAAWLSGLLPLALLGAAIAVFLALGAPGLERRGIPVEEVAVANTVLLPGEIRLELRNDGPDSVALAQAIVNDRFVPFTQSDAAIGRLEGAEVAIEYPWIEGENYEIALLTSTGGTVVAEIEAATATPQSDAGFLGLMALIGVYVGVIPVAIGMFWLPFVRRIDTRWVQFLLALTVGLLVFLGIDAMLEGVELAGQGPQAFGGSALVFLGAIVSYLALAGIDVWVRKRTETARAAGRGGFALALLIALGIGLHNLGEGLAIGSAYSLGALALGATLIVGFALHNTTEGLAIVAPMADERPSLVRLVGLGLLAGAPVILGAWIGATAYDASLSAFLFGLGAGAIAQVVVQLAPSIRDRAGRVLHPLAVGGVITGLALMYVTGLAISI
jgi:zinc transporter ZupT